MVALLPDFFAYRIAAQHGLPVIAPKQKLAEQIMFLVWRRKHENDEGHMWLREAIKADAADVFSPRAEAAAAAD